jgi:hypothetical protein
MGKEIVCLRQSFKVRYIELDIQVITEHLIWSLEVLKPRSLEVLKPRSLEVSKSRSLEVLKVVLPIDTYEIRLVRISMSLIKGGVREQDWKWIGTSRYAPKILHDL